MCCVAASSGSGADDAEAAESSAPLFTAVLDSIRSAAKEWSMPPTQKFYKKHAPFLGGVVFTGVMVLVAIDVALWWLRSRQMCVFVALRLVCVCLAGPCRRPTNSHNLSRLLSIATFACVCPVLQLLQTRPPTPAAAATTTTAAAAAAATTTTTTITTKQATTTTTIRRVATAVALVTRSAHLCVNVEASGVLLISCVVETPQVPVSQEAKKKD